MIKKLVIIFFVIWLITLLIPAGGGRPSQYQRVQELLERQRKVRVQRWKDAVPEWADAVQSYEFSIYIDEYFRNEEGVLIIQLEDDWHLLPKQTRLQYAKNMWTLWAKQLWDYESARIKLIDKIGNEVGGRSKGSDVKVND